jgi:[ribosomal protein S18]-alanine N-acetyltransferase
VAQLRRYRKQDLAGLHHLDQVCFPQDIAYSKAELQHFLNHPLCFCWIAEHADHKLAGFVITERARHSGRSAGHIVTLDVDPSARRCGLGTLLMQAAENQMKQEGAGLMSLEVAQNNATALQFYRGLGFVSKGKIAKYYGGSVDAEIMEKAI